MTAVSDIVDRLGGAEALAARFSISRKAIEMWERRGGVPGRWHVSMLVMAREQGIRLTPEELAPQTKKVA